MENVLLIMTLLCLLAGVFKNSLAPGRYYPLVFAVLCAAAVWFSGRYAVRVNKLSVSEALEDFKVMQDVNIVVTLHLLLILGFAASKLKKVFGLARPWYLRMLEYLPALLVLPAFFYLYLSLLFSFVGVPFGWMGGILSVLALLLVGGGAYLLRMAPRKASAVARWVALAVKKALTLPEVWMPPSAVATRRSWVPAMSASRVRVATLTRSIWGMGSLPGNGR